jgi:hypothetical protein
MQSRNVGYEDMKQGVPGSEEAFAVLFDNPLLERLNLIRKLYAG